MGHMDAWMVGGVDGVDRWRRAEGAMDEGDGCVKN